MRERETIAIIRSVVTGEAPVEDWALNDLIEAVGVIQALVGAAPEELDYRVELKLRGLVARHEKGDGDASKP